MKLQSTSSWAFVLMLVIIALTNESMKYKTSPLIDPYLYARYSFQIAEAKRLGLIRNTFDLKEWIEPRFLEGALRELQLEKLWVPRDESGQPKG